MEINIRAAGPGADEELGSLYSWLREDPEIYHYARMSLEPAEPGPSELGATFEVIQLIVDSGFQTLNLALAYATWRATRTRHPEITIERDGIKVTLDDANSHAVEEIVRALSQ